MEIEKEGFPVTALSGIRILQLLNHENIALSTCWKSAPNIPDTRPSTFDLVFYEHDLAGLLSNINAKFSFAEIKKVLPQSCEGLFFIHTNKIIQSIET